MLERLSKLLFGFDLFVSYPYADGKQYAEALEKRLSNLDYSCFLDKEELTYGKQLSWSLRRAIRRSKAVVLVGTAGALDAPYVQLEVSAALDAGQAVVPIDVDRIRERVPAARLRELRWLEETETGRAERRPSAVVLESIGDHFRFTRRNTLTRRLVGVAAVVFFVVAAVAVWFWRQAVVQRDLALSRQLAAQAENVLAEPPDRALLLAAAALDAADTFEARDALLRALQSRPGLVTLIHDAGKVRRLAFSAVGDRLVATASGGARLEWSLASGRPVPVEPDPAAAPIESPELPPAAAELVARLEEGGQPVRTAALDPDGELLAVAHGHEVRVLRLADGQPLGPPRSAQRPYVRALAFSPDGRLLASGSSSGTIALWQARPSEAAFPGRALHGLRVSANSVAFAPDADLLAGGGYGGELILWRLADGQPLAPALEAHPAGVRALRFGADGSRLVSVGPTARRWQVSASGLAPLGEAQELPAASAAAVSPDLATVALGNNAGEVQLWSLAAAAALGPPRAEHGDRLLALAFSPDGATLASAGNGREIRLWSAASGTPLAPPLEAHTRPVAALDWSADSRRLASYDSDGTLILWDAATRGPLGRPLTREQAYAGASAMALSPDGTTAATSGREGVLNLWDVDTWRPLGEPLDGHPGNVVAMAFGPRGRLLASAGLGGTVILWQLDAEAWARRACAIANRDLTPEERAIYLPPRLTGRTGPCGA